MKKLLLLVALIGIVFAFCSCNNNDDNHIDGIPETIIDNNQENSDEPVLDNLEILGERDYIYEISFKDYFSIEEYVELTSHLRKALNEPSLEPVHMISENVLFVKRTIDTYDKFEEAIAVVTTDGIPIQDWNAEWKENDILSNGKCGEYFFVIKKSYYYDYDCDVINKEGMIISTIRCKGSRYDIGDRYVFYTSGNDYGNIMNPSGEVIPLQCKSVYPSYGNADGSLREDTEIGQMSEGLFYGYSKGNVNTVAYYYNTKGEVVIDLSTQAVSFQITKLSNFSGGQAHVEFIGANGKNYTAVIDKSGNFIGEPVEI